MAMPCVRCVQPPMGRGRAMRRPILQATRAVTEPNAAEKADAKAGAGI